MKPQKKTKYDSSMTLDHQKIHNQCHEELDNYWKEKIKGAKIKEIMENEIYFYDLEKAEEAIRQLLLEGK